MKVEYWSMVLLAVAFLASAYMDEESSRARQLYLGLRNVIFHAIGSSSTGRALKRAVHMDRVQTPVPAELPFPCNTTNARSRRRPASVHRLRPGDIDVVGAMGDSLTAGIGATATRLFHLSIENRGVSWSIGDQGTWRQYLTLANILKEFNPNLVGGSLADSLSHHVESQFNVAELGSMSRDMSFMARELVKRIRADRRVNFYRDWKLISMLIGANDFCLEICYLSEREFNSSAERHRRELTSALDYLRDNLPRTLVNLVLVPNLEILHDLKGLPSECDSLHLITCPCLFGIVRERSYADNIAQQREWQRVQREVAADERYRRKDFAVVLQPFTRHLVFPEMQTARGLVADRSYLSVDCFHFSQKAHARAANALWNNMLEPVGSKSEDWTPTFSRFLCPTEERPYIFTQANSFPNAL